MMYTDNPEMDAISHEKEQERWLARRPVCVVCREPIQDDTMFVINGDCLCEDCMRCEYEQTISEDREDY